MNTDSIRKCKMEKDRSYWCFGQIVDPTNGCLSRSFLLLQTILLPVKGSANAELKQKDGSNIVSF